MHFSKYWNEFATWIYSNLSDTLKIMYSLITKFPKIAQMGELYDVWQFVTIVSIFCMMICIVFLATKLFVNAASSTNRIKMNSIFGRLIYATSFIAISRPAIDLLIDFNNTLVDVFVVKFKLIDSIGTDVYVNNWVGLVAVGLAIFQLYMAVKIMIGYFLRVAEVALIYVTTPIMCCIWINPSWGGHFNAWLTRLVSLIFTQFGQVLILVIYSKLIFGFYSSVNLYNLYLGSAFLVLMYQMPNWIQKYIAPDSSGKVIMNTYRQVKKSSVPKRVYNKVSSKDDKGDKEE